MAVEDITRRRDKEMQKGGKVQTLDSKLKELAKDLAKTRMQLDLKKQTIAEDEKRVVDAESAMKEVCLPPSQGCLSICTYLSAYLARSSEGREESFACSSYGETCSDQRQLRQLYRCAKADRKLVANLDHWSLFVVKRSRLCIDRVHGTDR